MEDNETWMLPPNMSANNSWHWKNFTEPMYSIYVFTPAGIIAKRVLYIILSIIGATGFLGNCLICYFIWKRPTRSPVQASPFMKNLTVYLRSLTLSDVLCCAVSLPLLCIQMSFDVFQRGWACKVIRYLNFVFPVITIDNLVVISLEKYLSTRTVPRTFSVSTVRKMIICTWVLGIVVAIFPAATYSGIRVDLNHTHYTVICYMKQDFYPFKLTLILFPLQYVLPCAFVTYANICLIKTVWFRRRRAIGNVVNNTFRANLRSASIRGTTLLTALTFAFIIPYLFYIGNIAYTQVAKPKRDFSTEYLLRFGTGGIAYLICVFNFVIYFVQMKDFREFLRKLFCRKEQRNRVNHAGLQGAKVITQDLNMERHNTLQGHA